MARTGVIFHCVVFCRLGRPLGWPIPSAVGRPPPVGGGSPPLQACASSWGTAACAMQRGFRDGGHEKWSGAAVLLTRPGPAVQVSWVSPTSPLLPRLFLRFSPGGLLLSRPGLLRVRKKCIVRQGSMGGWRGALLPLLLRFSYPSASYPYLLPLCLLPMLLLPMHLLPLLLLPSCLLPMYHLP